MIGMRVCVSAVAALAVATGVVTATTAHATPVRSSMIVATAKQGCQPKQTIALAGTNVTLFNFSGASRTFKLNGKSFTVAPSKSRSLLVEYNSRLTCWTKNTVTITVK
ncbi:MAG: hypothetical protein QOG53_3115 [Frankiales bacterium]|jgi:hypothetical protein|nr:hypothetical protein [Frankiales bacterium]